MNKLTTLLALAAVSIPAATLASPAEQRFTRAGVTYVYTIAPAKNGAQIIEGRRLDSGSAFRLVVNGTRVDGVSGGYPVSFSTRGMGPVEVAAR